MSKEEQINSLIDQLVNVRLVKKAADKEQELARQEKILSVKLETMGVALDKLPE